MKPYHAFTSVSNRGLLLELRNEVGVAPAGVAHSGDETRLKVFHAVWDTGAVQSTVPQFVVDACGLIS